MEEFVERAESVEYGMGCQKACDAVGELCVVWAVVCVPSMFLYAIPCYYDVCVHVSEHTVHASEWLADEGQSYESCIFLPKHTYWLHAHCFVGMAWEAAQLHCTAEPLFLCSLASCIRFE